MTSHSTQPPLRKEDARLLRGRARFVDNVHLDRLVEGDVRAQPVGSCRDCSDRCVAGARRRRNCRSDCSGSAFQRCALDRALLASEHPQRTAEISRTDRVRFVGEPVAFVVATDRYRAEDLARLVDGGVPVLAGNREHR